MPNTHERRAHSVASRAADVNPPTIEVVFYKEILDHRGFPHRCELMRVRCAATKDEEAVSGAIHRFEKLQRVTMWKIAADGYEIVVH